MGDESRGNMKKIGKILLRILLVIVVTIGVCFLIPRPKSVATNNFMIESGTRPLLIAHGGGNREFPDNTIEAFYNAYNIDPNCMMETDVSITKDGVVILSHDRSLDRKTNVSGDIYDWNYTDLVAQEVNFNYENETSGDNGYKTSDTLIQYKDYNGKTVTPLDVAYPDGVTPRHESKFLVTTLEELITSFPNNTINVEIKQTDEMGLEALEAVIELMKKLDSEGYNVYERVVLASFHDNVYAKIKEYQQELPDLRFSPNEGGIVKLYVTHWVGLDFIYNEPASVLQIPLKQRGLPLDTSFFISASHRHNLAVHYWTIDDKDDMKKLVKNGADGIMTNIPSRLKEVLDELFGEGNSPVLITNVE